MQILRAADRVPTPWLNGGGVTREVAAGPPGAGLSGFDWRVSLADVAASGPFSAFAGIDRIITVVAGAGMTLTVDGVPTTVTDGYGPFAFPGDAATDCVLVDGPIVDFNVMTRRGRTTARVELVTGTVALDGPTVLVVVLSGRAEVSTAVTEPSTAALGPYDAALLADRPAALAVDGLAAVVHLDPARPGPLR
ncbi:HutD family protein [Longispora sp. NPDC051575]|uniref:HutD/Ves family protein n=1 Tax=Longispora sp. NPDC051575 TaxID=3154943 RepID=UPI00341FD3FE